MIGILPAKNCLSQKTLLSPVNHQGNLFQDSSAFVTESLCDVGQDIAALWALIALSIQWEEKVVKVSSTTDAAETQDPKYRLQHPTTAGRLSCS
jgi:hypothetical protein